MPIQLNCPNPQCGQPISCPDDLAGKQVSCPKCRTAILVPGQPSASPGPQRLGNYTIVRKVGEGGMGAVYEAIQAGMDRRVALKVLSPKLMEKPAFLERFRREARAAGSLNHPNMVTVYETGEAGGHHFIAMEFIDGETLRQRLKRTDKLPVEEGLGIVRKVAQALHYAWEHGKIIHRDVKPDNIMLTRDGQVKLADLGLAKSIEEDTTVTAVGAGIGTPAYMAPEQSQSAKDVDCRADIYSLGITLFQILTGQLPFEAETPYAVVTAHLEQPLPDPKSLNPMIPQPISDLIYRMCAKKAAQRFQTPGALVEEIDAIIECGSSPSQQKPMRDPFREQATVPVMQRRRTARKSRSPVPAIFGVVLALGLAGGLGYVFLGKGTSGKPTTTTITTTTTKGVGGQPVLQIKEMFDYAMTYAEEHPEEYAEVINKFEEVRQKAEGTAYAMQAEDQVREWKEKWDQAGEAEVQKRNALVTAHLGAGEFEKARGVWDDFPESLKTEATVAKITEALARIEEALKSLVGSIEKEVAALLRKEPKDLTPDDLKALLAAKAKALSPPAGLPAEAKKALASLAQEIDECLNGFQESLKAKAAEAFEAFWVRYEALVKEKKFDDAVALGKESEKPFVVPPLGDPEEEPAKGGTTNEWAPILKLLVEDAQLLKKLFATAEENLPELKGKTVRIGGMVMKVSDVKDGRVYVKQDEAEMAWDLEKLEDDTILMLALLGDKDPQSIARQKALFAFYYGRVNEVAAKLNEATEAGVDVAFYLSRLTPVLVVTTSPPGADVVLKKMVDGRLVEVGEDALASPLRQDLDKNSLYRVEVSKEGYASVTETVRTGEGGQHRVSVRLKKEVLPALPSGLIAYYPMNGDAQDKTKWGNHGEVNGAVPTRDRFGREDGAYAFDGKISHILIGQDVAIKKVAGLTLNAWVRNPQAGMIVFQGGWCPDLAGAFKGLSFALWVDERGSLAMTVYGGRGDWTDPSNHITSQKTVPQDGRWHHLAAVFDKGNLKIHIDGEPDPASPKYYSDSSGRGRLLPTSRFQEVADSTDSIRIGCAYIYRGRKNQHHFSGEIDDVAIYERALTQTEIRAVMKAKSLVTPAKPGRGPVVGLPAREALVAYYAADGNAEDASGNGHQGFNNGASWTTDRHGKAKGAFLFDGRRGFIKVDDSKELDTDESFSVSVWVKPRTFINAAGRPAHLVRKWYTGRRAGNDGNGDYILALGKDGEVAFQVANGDQAWQSDALSSGARVRLSEWTHVAATFHQGQMKLYIGGNLDASKVAEMITRTTTAEYRHDDITIGAVWDHDMAYDGAIDDVAIYNRALTPKEVKALTSATPPGGAAVKIDVEAFLGEELEIPKAVRDQHGNPIRKGTDKATGLPLEIRHKKTGMYFVFIPAGEFMMGSPVHERGQYVERERPQHRVRITNWFYMGKYEVRTGEFAKFVKATAYVTSAEKRGGGRVWVGNQWVERADANWRTPNYRQTEDFPAVLLTWDDASQFSEWLCKTGGDFSLPTEAQWEHACRAGAATRYHFGDDPEARLIDSFGWYRENSGGMPHAVGRKKPNRAGLYDMVGNVCEYVSDWYGTYHGGDQMDPTGPARGTERTKRGGAFVSPAGSCRSAMRSVDPPLYRTTISGSRVVLNRPTGRDRDGGAAVGGIGADARAFIKAEFEPVNAVRDKHGNPIRKGTDKATGLPLEVRHKKTGMYLVFIPAGEFMMGSPAGEIGRDAKNAAREAPQRRVRLTKPFYLGNLGIHLPHVTPRYSIWGYGI